LYLPRTAGHSRLGFAIAKKRVSRASARNRLKRVARESFRHNRESLATPPAAFDVVILANRGAILASNAELFASLEKHWQKLRNHSSSPPA
jgi:ribonuclease P protein component